MPGADAAVSNEINASVLLPCLIFTLDCEEKAPRGAPIYHRLKICAQSMNGAIRHGLPILLKHR